MHNKNQYSNQTLKEEIINAISHGTGVLLSIDEKTFPDSKSFINIPVNCRNVYTNTFDKSERSTWLDIFWNSMGPCNNWHSAEITFYQ